MVSFNALQSQQPSSMYQSREQSTPRSNNFMGARAHPLQVYVFGSSQETQLQRKLMDTLQQRSHSYELQTTLASLDEIKSNKPNQQRLILILSNIYSEEAVRQQMDKNGSDRQSSEKVHIYTYPDQMPSLGLKRLSSLKEVIAVCEKLKCQTKKHKSIRLAGVHSIDKSLSSSKMIKKVSTDSHYQNIKYLRNNLYGLYENELYDKITEIFVKESTFEPYMDLNSAVESCKDLKNKKALLMAPANHNEDIIRMLKKKSKENIVEVILVGPINANQYVLSKNIVLATNSPNKLYQYLKEKNMISPHIVTFMFEELIRSERFTSEGKIRDDSSAVAGDQAWEGGRDQAAPLIVSDFFNKISESTPANGISNDYQVGSDKKEETKPKIKKIKSPAKSRPSEVKQNDNDISIRVSQPHDQPIKQTETYRTNKQGERIRKSEESTGEPISIATSPDIPYPPPTYTHHYPTAHDIRQHPSAQMKSNRYRHPSMIIHETSDEYRGSNKESIMNIEADTKFSAQHNQPMEEIAQKKIITATYNQPETYYLQSDSTIKEKLQQSRHASEEVDIGTSKFNQSYQSQRQVYRKQIVSQPQEVRQESNTHIVETARFEPTARPAETVNIYHNSSQQNVQTGNRISSYYPYNRAQASTQNVYSPYSLSKNVVSPQKPPGAMVGQGSNNITVYRRQAGSPSNYAYFQNTSSSKNLNQHPNIYQSTSRYNNITASSNSNTPNVNTYESRDNHNTPAVQKYVSNGQSNSISSHPIRNATSPRLEGKYNLEGFERVEVNGITMYRKKQTQPQEVDRDSSPKVQRYEVSPRREAIAIRHEFSNRPQFQPPQANIDSTVHRQATSSSYTRQPLYSRQYYNSSSHQVGPISITNQQRINPAGYRKYVSPEPAPKAQEQTVGTAYKSYKSGGGQVKEKADVQRYQYYEQRLQANNIPSSRTLNDSNWMSKPSDLHSDGSMLRRNNVRFGIKLRKKEDTEASVIESKLGSGIYTVKDLNKKMALTRKIEGEQELQREEVNFTHVNPGLTGFHYLLQEQLKYLESKLTPIFTYHDKIDYFSCLEDMVQKCQDPLECGFVIATQVQMLKLNLNLLPEDYYLVKIVERSPFLELNETQKVIQMDSLSRLPLGQKIVLDKKLFQYVAYRPGNNEMEAIAVKFRNTKFVVEKCEVDLTWEFIDGYFEEYPQLTRLYLLCRPEDVALIKNAVHSYKQLNSYFQLASLRLICLGASSVDHSKLTSAYPFITFLDYPSSLSYKEIISQVHQKDKKSTLLIKPDRLYLHESQESLMKDIQRQFPNRFEFYMYRSSRELPRKMLKRKQRGYSSYLVLHESMVGQKISFQSFRGVFVMGRAQMIPSQAVRVIKNQELIELLKN